MQWSPSLLVGNARLDEQHQRLFLLLDALADLPAQQGKAAAYFAISSLQTYVEEHLREEEALLRSIGYKDYDMHCKLHQVFEAKLDYLAGRLTTEEDAGVLPDLKTFVQGWLFNHISFADQLFKPHLSGD